MERLELKVEGMGCKHCIQAIREALLEEKGIEEVEVDLELGEVLILGDGTWKREELKEKIQDAGYLLTEEG